MKIAPRITIIVTIMILSTFFSGCIESTNEEDNLGTLVIAYEIKDNLEDIDNNPQILADYLSDKLNYDVSIFNVASEGAMIEALRFGNADIAVMDAGSGWMGWQQHGLEVLAADLNEDGKSYYNSHAWVKRDSEIGMAQIDGDRYTDPYSLLASKNSCHTGWLKSTGMLIPMGFLIGHGYANIIGDPNDVETIRNTIYGFFGENSSIPDVGSPYYGDEGALRCLSEGKGEVAFANENTVEAYCGAGDGIERNNNWCGNIEDYVALPTFGKSPSNPLMYNPSKINNSLLEQLEEILIEMDNEIEGISILKNIFNSLGFISTNATEHLSEFSSLMSNIPGISAYYDDKYEINNSISPSLDKIRIGFEINNISNDSNPELLGKYLENTLGIEVEVHIFNSEIEILDALDANNIDIGLVNENAAWYGWKQYSLAVMAAIKDEDGRSKHESKAWIRSGSDIAIAHLDDDEETDPFELLNGKISCHTSLLDSAGTFIPLGNLINNGYINSFENDIENFSIINTIQTFLSKNSSIPDEEDDYYGEDGALKCLSKGTGDVAFIKYNAIEKFCNGPESAEWCLDAAQYISLPTLGEIPTKSIIYNPNYLDIQTRTAILNSLMTLNYEMYVENYSVMGNTYTGCYDISVHVIDEESPKNNCGSEILHNVLDSSGIITINSQDHLGKYSEIIINVPKIIEYQQQLLQA